MKAGLCLLQAMLCGLLAGCGLVRSNLDRQLLTKNAPEVGPDRFAEVYSVRFPDVLEVCIADRPELSGDRPLRVDGRIDLSNGDCLSVEGKSVRQIGEQIARHFKVDADQVKVRVEGHNSQRLFLRGEVAGDTRAVAYIGPETVLEMLQRVGGITPGAAPSDIQVIRAQISDGKQPEVFDVDLEAILLKNDQQTNIKLRPFDQISVGQCRSCCIQKCLPPWMRPLFAKMCGLSRPGMRHGPQSPALAERPLARYRASGSE